MWRWWLICFLISRSRHVFTNLLNTSLRIFSPIFLSWKKTTNSLLVKKGIIFLCFELLWKSKQKQILHNMYSVDSYLGNSWKHVVSLTSNPAFFQHESRGRPSEVSLQDVKVFEMYPHAGIENQSIFIIFAITTFAQSSIGYARSKELRQFNIYKMHSNFNLEF